MKRTVQHLSSFRKRLQVKDHFTSVDKSFCRSEQSDRHLESSAKSITKMNERTDGKLFTKIRNKSGPRMVFSGIPERTGNTLELDWSTEITRQVCSHPSPKIVRDIKV